MARPVKGADLTLTRYVSDFEGPLSSIYLEDRLYDHFGIKTEACAFITLGRIAIAA